MADPFSIAMGAFTLTQTCISLTKLLMTTKESLTNSGREADDAIKELSGLKLVCQSVYDVCQRVGKDDGSSALSIVDLGRLKELCGRLSLSVEDCKETMKSIETLFLGIFGPTNAPAGRRAIIKSTFEQLLKKGDLQEIRRKISTHHSNIQSQLTSLTAFYQIVQIDDKRKSLMTLSNMNTSIQRIQTSMQSVHSIVDQFLLPVTQSTFRPSLFGIRSIPLMDSGTRFVGTLRVRDNLQSTTGIHSEESSLRVGQDFIHAAKAAGLLQSPSVTKGASKLLEPQAEVFSTRLQDALKNSKSLVFLPKLLVTEFVGRSDLLTELVTVLNPSTEGHSSFQKRVVISGMGGVGKTQLALKVAHELRDSFFAVFWINGSSHQQFRAGWAKFAGDCGLEPDFQLGLNHLAALEKPWLLIVDNANGQEVHIEDYLPSGDFGCIIITTRYRSLPHLGTVGQKHYRLNGLSKEEGVQLLLTKAARRKPFSKSDVEVASQITDTLAHMPFPLSILGTLAARHPGSLGSFLKKIGRDKLKLNQRLKTIKRRLIYQRILLTVFDLLIQKLDDDAKQILELFYFFHYDNIPFGILLSRFRREHSVKATRDGNLADDMESAPTRPHFSLPILRRLLLGVDQLLQSPMVERLYRTPSVLPKILDPSCTDLSVAEARVQAALMALESYSLIFRDDQAGVFRMNQVLQEIIQKKFHSIAQETITCEAALIILTNCIELEKETYNNAVVHFDSRYLLPHIIRARERSQDILLRYRIRQESSEPLRSLMPKFKWSASTSRKSDPLRLMKFSIIYFSSGEYQEARILQEEARSFLLLAWGTMLNPQCLHASFALAQTYHRLYLFDKAVELQRQIIHASEELYGKQHNFTLNMTDILGLFYLSRGDLSESLQHLQQALSGLEKLHENRSQHKTTLTALNHLGIVQAQYYRWNESRRLCELAMDGLQLVDPESNEIYLAKQNVAIANIHLKDSWGFAEAEYLMTDVLKHWSESLGSRHPNTLLATFNMSRVLLCREKIQEAEDVLVPALKVAESRLGSGDFGYLSARMLLACIKLHQRSYTQAEQILIDLNDSYTEMSSSAVHVDRITTLWYLMECYKEQGRFDEALEVYEEMSDLMKAAMTFNLRVKHPLAKNLIAKRQELEALKQCARIAIMRALEANVNGLE